MKKTLLSLLAALLMASCGEKKETATKEPISVKTEVVGSTGQPAASPSAYVGVVEEREATAVSFTSMGVVKRVLVSEGQAVSRGQLIAVMDDTQARNLLAGAKASVAQAEDALARFKMLHDNGSLPEVQWVEIQSKVAQARSQLEVAKKNVADCQLVAPVSGIVGRRQTHAGETALPSQAVVTILDVSTVKVKVSVPEAEIGRISSHTPTDIYVEAAGKHAHGGRIEKGMTADALTHTYDVRISVPNADRRLLPGMVADVSFATAGGQGARPSLPVTAVQKKADGTLFVWTVAADSTAHRTRVTLGSTVGNRTLITSGIDAGVRVVTEGYQKLSEGSKVRF